jgi:hypothetical protein
MGTATASEPRPLPQRAIKAVRPRRRIVRAPGMGPALANVARLDTV